MGSTKMLFAANQHLKNVFKSNYITEEIQIVINKIKLRLKQLQVWLRNQLQTMYEKAKEMYTFLCGKANELYNYVHNKLKNEQGQVDVTICLENLYRLFMYVVVPITTISKTRKGSVLSYDESMLL